MTITQYLGNGAISRGRLTISPALNVQVSTVPYLRNATDKEAVIQGIDTIRAALKNVQNLTWIKPTAEQTTTSFVNSVCSLNNGCILVLTNHRFPMFYPPEIRITGLALIKLVPMMDVVVGLLSLILTPRCMERTTSLLWTHLFSQG
jgi:hypothetical protein